MYIYLYTHIHIYSQAKVYMCILVCVHTYTHVYAHICMHILHTIHILTTRATPVKSLALSLSHSLLLSTRQNDIGQSHLDHTRNAKERLNEDAHSLCLSFRLTLTHSIIFSLSLALSFSQRNGNA